MCTILVEPMCTIPVESRPDAWPTLLESESVMKFQIYSQCFKQLFRIPMVVAPILPIGVNVEMIILPIFHCCRQTALLL